MGGGKVFASFASIDLTWQQVRKLLAQFYGLSLIAIKVKTDVISVLLYVDFTELSEDTMTVTFQN